MLKYKVAERYAKALFNVQAPQEVVERRMQMLDILAQTLKMTPTLLLHPHIVQGKPFEHFLADALLFAFLGVVKKHRKFRFLPDIARAYRRLVEASSETKTATLITPFPLDAALKQKVQHYLESFYQNPLHIHEKIDAKLIGGGIVIVGNRIVDFSMKGRLTRMKHAILSQL